MKAIIPYFLRVIGLLIKDIIYGKTGELPLDRDGDAVVTFPIPETETGLGLIFFY